MTEENHDSVAEISNLIGSIMRMNADDYHRWQKTIAPNLLKWKRLNLGWMANVLMDEIRSNVDSHLARLAKSDPNNTTEVLQRILEVAEQLFSVSCLALAYVKVERDRRIKGGLVRARADDRAIWRIEAAMEWEREPHLPASVIATSLLKRHKINASLQTVRKAIADLAPRRQYLKKETDGRK